MSGINVLVGESTVVQSHANRRRCTLTASAVAFRKAGSWSDARPTPVTTQRPHQAHKIAALMRNVVVN
jgi:hypothetical protein